MTDGVIFFEVNNWFPGRDYPDCEPFLSWLRNDLKLRFEDEKWCKENKICVQHEIIYMSQNFRVTASIEWVQENCPDLLSNPDLSKFLRLPGENGYCDEGYGEAPFLEYSPENYGYHFYDFNEDY